eukprot:TRINITY_DN9239_c0_g3_i1.p1 TRINITY_DN9239_c0_g3~~TRINITY_DN9239_c0_g3_i1.p1  ORF type:complete len:319 (+),score=46.73 TRINITY_DN9239_c0_g3_i1:57-1013(+)
MVMTAPPGLAQFAAALGAPRAPPGLAAQADPGDAEALGRALKADDLHGFGGFQFGMWPNYMPADVSAQDDEPPELPRLPKAKRELNPDAISWSSTWGLSLAPGVFREVGIPVAAIIESEALEPAKAQPSWGQCRWHKSANSVGSISADGHVFTKSASGRKVFMNSRGQSVELSTICMVFDSSLRCGGAHRYCYHIHYGELGAADGAGFVFDSQVRRTNIQRMRSVFLNQRGFVCVRDREQVTKLGIRLPPLGVGMSLTLEVDLDNQSLTFAVFGCDGNLSGVAPVELAGLFPSAPAGKTPTSGFFCAIVTRDICVELN